MHEMKLVLAMSIEQFDFQTLPECEAELELGKFGLFISAFPKRGVQLAVSHRPH